MSLNDRIMRMFMDILIAATLLIITFYLLAILVDEFFVDSLDQISKKLKLSSEVAGATFMAVGSSAPELFTSLIAVLRGGNSEIGAGTIVGSAIFNILVIIGASAAYKKAKLTWQPVMRDLIFYCASIIILLVSFWDGSINIYEAISFVILYIVYVFSVTKWSKWFKYKVEDPGQITEKARHKSNNPAKKALGFIIPDPHKKYVPAFLVSILLIAILSFVMVESAVHIAHAFSISPAIIGLTILAAGTSIPDLISSITVAKQGRGDMAIANAVGSNIFDILFGLGVPWIIAIHLFGENIQVGNENLMSSVFLLFATVLAVFFVLAIRKWEISKRAGILLIILYIIYILFSIYNVVYA